MQKNNNKKEKGFIVSVIAFFVLLIMAVLALGANYIVLNRREAAASQVESTQAYYASEAGAEDALEHLANNYNMASKNYTLQAGSAIANVSIQDPVGGSRAVVSDGEKNGKIKRVRVVFGSDTSQSGFYYGVQADGGFDFGNGSKIIGNVYANGSITGAGTITGTAVNTGTNIINGQSNGNRMTISENVYTYNCKNAVVSNNLSYAGQASGNSNCAVSGQTSQMQQISPAPLPVSDAQIADWKSEASAGGDPLFDTSVSGNLTVLGPVKILGNLTINNNAILTMKGSIYVTGNIILGNNATIKMDSSYGALSGVIVSDGVITMGNNSTLSGSGQQGSYLMALSTNASTESITAINGLSGVTLYASNGGIYLQNSSGGNNQVNVNVRQITAKKLIKLGNNITLDYEVGLSSPLFISGPKGKGKVLSWTEE